MYPLLCHLVLTLCLKEWIDGTRSLRYVTALSEWRLTVNPLLTSTAVHSGYPALKQLPLPRNGWFPPLMTLSLVNAKCNTPGNRPTQRDRYQRERSATSVAPANRSPFFSTPPSRGDTFANNVWVLLLGFCPPQFASIDKSNRLCVGSYGKSGCSSPSRKASMVRLGGGSDFGELRSGIYLETACLCTAKERTGACAALAELFEVNTRSVKCWARRAQHNGEKRCSEAPALWAFPAEGGKMRRQRDCPAGLVGLVKPKGITSMDVCRGVSELLKPYRDSPERGPALLGEDDLPFGPSQPGGGVRERHGGKGRRKTGVGHGGTLDPAATGVLVLGIGEGTKRLRHFLTGWKQYKAVVRLGVATDTLDCEGRVVAEEDWRHVTLAKLKSVLPSFLGKQLQQPPLFSAKRVNGVRMYDIARSLQEQQDRRSQNTFPHIDEQADSHEFFGHRPEGRQASVAPLALRQQLAEALRPHASGGRSSTLQQAVLKHTSLPKPCEIEISKLEVVDEDQFEMPQFAISVTCSKGTYIRQLAADIAVRCGTVGHLTDLTRTFQAPFRLEDCVEFEGLTADRLLRRLIPVQVVDRILREKQR
uniref:tRNA pseudouridine(55) synthase n=1 Tax=Neospora caninum (strain Liverpool) TaxID=572307 RepID=A0A0F7UJH6_NEOCL|nr:TPA: tRNA pseudouridine synthase B, putative [Neospora caninum Liverpool]